MDANLRIAAMLTEDDDMLLLTSSHEGTSPVKTQLDWQNVSDLQYKHMFRFGKQDIEELRAALGLPEKIICSNRTTATGTESLCILLRRLAYPNRLDDLSPIFGRSKAELSYILNTVLDFIYTRHEHLLRNVDQPWILHHLQRFADAVKEKDAPLDNCWGFIDGTVRPICRPSRNQRLVFNGHKRVHGLKFQSVTTPSGMIANLYGPIEGKRHDAGMLRMSGLLHELENNMNTDDGTTYSLYGDPAYPHSPYIITPYKGAALTAEEALFNKTMSSVRVSVEWAFGKIISLFAFLDYKKNQKLYLQPVGKYYAVASILSNCHTCMYGSQTGDFFGLDPPALNEYLQS